MRRKRSNPLHHRRGFNILRSSWYNTHISLQFLLLFLWKWCSIKTKQFDFKSHSVIESFLVAEHNNKIYHQCSLYGAFLNSTFRYTWHFFVWTNIARTISVLNVSIMLIKILVWSHLLFFLYFLFLKGPRKCPISCLWLSDKMKTRSIPKNKGQHLQTY